MEPFLHGFSSCFLIDESITPVFLKPDLLELLAITIWSLLVECICDFPSMPFP